MMRGMRILLLEAIVLVPLFIFFVYIPGVGSTAVISQYAKALVLCILTAPFVFTTDFKRLIKHPFWLSVLIVLVYRLISAGNAFIINGSFILAYFAAVNIYFADDFFKDKVRIALIAVLVISSLYNLLQFYNADFLGLFSGEMVSFFGNPNIYSEFAAPAAFVLFSPLSPIGIVTFIFVAAVIVITGSRAAILALSLTTLLAVLGFKKRVRIGLIIIAGLILIFGAKELSSIKNIRVSRSFRGNVYTTALNQILQAGVKGAIFGLGTDSFEKNYDKHTNKFIWQNIGQIRVANIHNEFVAFINESGLIVSALFFSVLAGGFILLKKTGRLMLISFLIMSLFGFPLHISSSVMIFLLIFALYLKRDERAAQKRRYRSGIIAGILFLVFFVSAYFAIEYKAEYHFRTAEFAKAHNADGAAVQNYIKTKNNPAAFYNYGFLMAKYKHWNKGGGLIRKSLKYWTYNQFALAELGFIHYKKGDVYGAEHFYKDALEHNPYYVKGWQNLIKILTDTKKYKKAVSTARLAISSTGSRQFYKNIGDVFYSEGKYADALDMHLKALPAADASLYNNIATDYVKLGRLKEAVQYYETAINTDPHFITAIKNLKAVKAYLNEN